MPSIKSSSKGGSSVSLFSSERKQLTEVYKTCDWLSKNWHGDIADASLDVCESIEKLFTLMPSTGRWEKVKPETKPAA